jgi:uncharacterized membrane protein
MSTKKLSWLSLFIALSVIGGMIKIPAFSTSVALDSFPAILAAGLLGAGPGALVAALGHLVSALIGGMPLGPFHVLIAAEMAAIVWVFAKVYHSGNKLAAFILFVFLNGVISGVPFIWLISWEFYAVSVPSLFIAAAINGILAGIALPRLMPIAHKFWHKGEVKA